MYYRLKEPWAFRGWKRTPHAIRALAGEHRHDAPLFLDKGTFLELLYCNGEEYVDPAELGDEARRAIEEMTAAGMMEQSETRMAPLSPRQRYHVYPARYVESVHWSVTGRCNFRCRHCLVSAPSAHHPQLPLSDCIHIIHEIASCGITAVDITGGEPLVRGDFEDIVEELSACGIDVRVMFTNASLLDERTLAMFERHGQRPSFQLSFDGLGHHDWLRGVAGAEEQADKAFHLLKERGYPVAVGMCIHRENKDSLRATIRYLSGLGVASLNVNAPQTLGVWRRYADEYALAEDEVWAVYRDGIGSYFEDGMPIDLELDGYFFCQKGSTAYKVPYVRHPPEDADWAKIPQCESMRRHIYIGAEGRLAPCMAFADTEMAQAFPSVLEEHLGKLSLEGNSYYDVVNTRASDFLRLNPECAGCGHFRACGGGCMAQGVARCGDHFARDERACYFHRHIGERAVREVADRAIERMSGKQGERR